MSADNPPKLDHAKGAWTGMCVRAPPPLLQLLNRADENVNYIIKNNLYNLGYNYRPRSSSPSLRSLYYARVSYVLLQCHATTCRCNMCRATQVQVHLKVARARFMWHEDRFGRRSSVGPRSRMKVKVLAFLRRRSCWGLWRTNERKRKPGSSLLLVQWLSFGIVRGRAATKESECVAEGLGMI